MIQLKHGLSVQILMSLVKEPDDLVSCEIAEKKSSNVLPFFLIQLKPGLSVQILMSLVKEPDDLVSCEIAEKKSSKGRLSSTYLIDIKFKVNSSCNVLLFSYS